MTTDEEFEDELMNIDELYEEQKLSLEDKFALKMFLNIEQSKLKGVTYESFKQAALKKNE